MPVYCAFSACGMLVQIMQRDDMWILAVVVGHLKTEQVEWLIDVALIKFVQRSTSFGLIDTSSRTNLDGTSYSDEDEAACSWYSVTLLDWSEEQLLVTAGNLIVVNILCSGTVLPLPLLQCRATVYCFMLRRFMTFWHEQQCRPLLNELCVSRVGYWQSCRPQSLALASRIFEDTSWRSLPWPWITRPWHLRSWPWERNLGQGLRL